MMDGLLFLSGSNVPGVDPFAQLLATLLSFVLGSASDDSFHVHASVFVAMQVTSLSRVQILPSQF